VYDLIVSAGEISRAEISRRTGISSPTVIKIINHFLDLGFVSFDGSGESRVGRKPRMLRLNPTAACSVGLDFQGDLLRIGIVDLLGGIIRRESFPIPPDFVAVLRDLAGPWIEQAIVASGIPRGRISGVGIGVPGAVSVDRRTVEVAPLVGITAPLDVGPLVGELEGRLGLPVLIEKDVNAAVLGEYVYRRDQESKDLVYISLGVGVGAGVILDGVLRRGSHNLAGEIGYLSFERGGTADPTRPGWLESRIGYSTIAADPEAAPGRILEDLAMAIACVTATLDVDTLVVGGIGAEILGPALIEGLNARLESLCLSPVVCSAPVCPDPGVVGAAWIVTESRLEQLLLGEAEA
jgi:predicted NBD/HSP70 family sugar kinase